MDEELYILQQQLLDDLTVAARQFQAIHWNLRTDKFLEAHPWFGEIYDTLSEYIDETAEQIHSIDKFPITTLRHALETSNIPEITITGPISYDQAMNQALLMISRLKETTTKVLYYADNNGYFGETEKYSAHVLYYEHLLYFLKSSIDAGKFNYVKAKNATRVQKYYDDEQLVFGWASVAKDKYGNYAFDWQDDILEAEDLEPAVYDYLIKSRVSNEMHQPGTVNGKVVESVVFTKEKMAAMGIPKGIVPEGWWVGFKINDRDAYMKAKTGIYKMFSIEGSAIREEVE